MYRLSAPILVLGVLGFGLPLLAEEAPPPKATNSASLETFMEVVGLEDGPGVENRALLAKAFKDMRAGDLAAAEKGLKEAQAKFQALCKDPKKTYVSVANRKELEAYKKDHPDQDVAWIDWSYLETMHMLAFVAASKRDFKAALDYLAQEEKVAPFSAAAHNERGYIFNHMGKYKEAVEEYKKGKALAERFETGRTDLPIALRGMGFALIELGQLDEAQKVFEQSLKIDPNNSTAKNELLYIEQMRQQKK
ncbi:MAG: tetratricopeptide repeat protein [Planctomycetota bacterium]|nr:tetratricopeptide repeat protein [Planctomycetota bacterium]